MDMHFWFETQSKLFPEAIYLDLINARPVGSKRVHRFVLPEKDPASILSQALTKAESDARTQHGGQHTYVLALVHPETGDSVSEFRFNSGDKDIGAAHDVELPTTEGVVKQMLRFNSNLHRDVRLAFKESQQALIQENVRLRDRCGSLEERHQQVMAMQEDLMSARHERELVAVKAMRAEGRRDKALSEVATILPAVTQRLLNAGAPAASSAAAGSTAAPSPESHLVSRLGNSLSDEQVRSLMSILSPAQQIAAYELFLKQRAQQQAPATEQAEAAE